MMLTIAHRSSSSAASVGSQQCPRAIPTVRGEMSQPSAARPATIASISVVPAPANGSRIAPVRHADTHTYQRERPRVSKVAHPGHKAGRAIWGACLFREASREEWRLRAVPSGLWWGGSHESSSVRDAGHRHATG